MVLIHMIDDATSRLLARFYDADTVLNHMDLLWRWLQAFGRPLALYTDRHIIFEPQDKGQALADAQTRFGRALRELSIELIRAHSPQAKGRVERSFGTAQDRVVKEMRLAKVKTIIQANALLDGGLSDKHNRMFSVPPRQAGDAHRSEAASTGVQPTGGRSGRTSAAPYPPDGEAEDSKKGPYRPAADHPWRRGFRTKRKE